MKTIVYSVLLCVSFIALVILHDAFPYIYLLLAGGVAAYLCHWLIPVPVFSRLAKLKNNVVNLISELRLDGQIINQKAGATIG